MSPRFPLKKSLRAVLLAVSLPALAITAYTGAAVAAAPAAAQAAQQGNIIISADQAKKLAASGAKIIDLRPAKDYAAGHIPGAINLPWIKFNQREVDGVRNEFASDEVIERELAAAGLSYDDTLVIYENSALPGRAYVVFDYAGFKKVHVLDGGVGAWKEKLSTEAVTPQPSAFKLSQKKEIRVDKKFVEGKVGKAGVTIIDGRDEEAYLDGHIPGAKNLPAPKLLTAERTLKPQSALTQVLADKQINPDDEIVSYCGSGVYAANNYLALRNQGYRNVAFYDASWDEWSRDPKAGQSVAYDNYTFDVTGTQTTAGSKSGVPQFINIDELKKATDDKKAVIVDVRAPADYDWGHIPNSVNVFWDTTLNADRTLKSAAELDKIYKAAGVTPDKRVIIYARGGYQLTHTYTALSLLGYKNIDFFTGKFEGWKSK
ncbi:sulfurtransferase [Thauera linaloolentis]|uniref:Thiosulfate sulfurtransferase n=1 Tax=Thauera linaloolentis (strain DSM 12138 / JCM 21573 / CCUG 41526 / CIP 105981 / IAM 15112 / NBRC 102519 / 47Lol) TaxID=1123367 RepID=N6YR61_THAL4|nr:sulfurtransferase [Thauera linaloolentis]ENO84852.1 thiosulfate sulfurtransferase [Thauera linaloolentis 47Lol = DSM 12138]MCM8564849.1 rhodanese-like domain-containing protein [Thauera linaloolentis]